MSGTNTRAQEIAGKLTKAQRARCRLDVIVLRNRHDTRVAINMEKKGLCEDSRHVNQMNWTPLGLEVRRILMEQDHG